MDLGTNENNEDAEYFLSLPPSGFPWPHCWLLSYLKPAPWPCAGTNAVDHAIQSTMHAILQYLYSTGT